MNPGDTLLRKENPRTRSNPLSAALFLYTLPIFWKFCKKEMTQNDLYEVQDEYNSTSLGNKLETIWKEENRKRKRCALHFALLRQFGLELALSCSLIMISQVISMILTPTAVGGLVLYFQKGSLNVNVNDGYYYTGMLFSLFAIRIFVGHSLLMWTANIFMKMRIACSSLIYRKSLKLSASALSQTTIGQIVNLLSNDLGKFDQGILYWQYVLIAPVLIGIGMYQLYSLIGVAACWGMGFLLLWLPLQIFLGRLNSKIRLTTAVRTDERLRIMNEILSGINVIKMYCWESAFTKLVSKARRYEIKATRVHLHIEAVRFALEVFVTRTSVFITIVVFAFLGNHITASAAYAITATYTILRTIAIALLSMSLNSLAEIHISLTRIQTFLNYDELQDMKISEDNLRNNLKCAVEISTKCPKTIESPRVVLKDVSVKWLRDLPNYALENINLDIKYNQLVALVGPVGSGKSTMFDVILRELPIISGTLDVCGKISFASQEPWLFTASVKQNILFGEEYNDTRYKKILQMCALEADLKVLPYGDSTIITEGGKSLSGGQKARLSLARCAYREADIYLLDDPLSAVDVKVGTHLYEQCIYRLGKNKICILATHQLQYLKRAQKIVILQDGKIVSQGSFDELQALGLDFVALLKQMQPGEDQQLIAMNKVAAQQSVNEQQGPVVSTIQGNKEGSASGSIGFNIYAQYFRAGGGCFLIFSLFALFIAAQIVGILGDYAVAFWVNLENNKTSTGSHFDTFMSRGAIIYTYSGIIVFTILLAIGNCFLFFIFVTRVSANLHNVIFEKVAFSPMRFFDENPIGRILNRFSKDVGIVDDYIPLVLMDTIRIGLLLGTTIALSVFINCWLLLSFVVLLIPVYYSRKFYIKTNRSAKRIEGLTRSPIFNHIHASVIGLPTVRAYGAQNVLIKEFEAHLDLHTSAWYLFTSTGRAFSFWIDSLTRLIIAMIIVYLLSDSQNYDSGTIGLIVTQYMALCTMLHYGMRQWCELENHMVSVERVLEYSKLETESTRKSIQSIPSNWPEYGKVDFRNVSLKYIADGPIILQNINFTILPGEKIGIVGRTGAGKSSIISALYQMYSTTGHIIIDNVDIANVSLSDLRHNISVIPQQPVLFSGTVRNNLDPLEQYNDNVIWNALQQVELKQIIETSVGGLSTPVFQNGSNFSVGQKQLICLARAILRRNRILVMDEATANVDPYTDAVIQRTIRQEFADCTVVTIAHRVHTVIDCNKVLVIDNGSAVEYDHPYHLLQMTNGLFYHMVETTGKRTFDNLLLIAEHSFKGQQI